MPARLAGADQVRTMLASGRRRRTRRRQDARGRPLREAQHAVPDPNRAPHRRGNDGRRHSRQAAGAASRRTCDARHGRRVIRARRFGRTRRTQSGHGAGRREHGKARHHRLQRNGIGGSQGDQSTADDPGHGYHNTAGRRQGPCGPQRRTIEIAATNTEPHLYRERSQSHRSGCSRTQDSTTAVIACMVVGAGGSPAGFLHLDVRVRF
jgi:hypothetical protein